MSFNSVEYFENIARKMKAIRHTDSSPKFFRASSARTLEELLNSGAVAQYPSIILFDKRDGKFEDRQSNNLQDRQFYQLLILQKSEQLDSDSRRQAIDESFSVCRKIISKMTKDWLEAQRIPNIVDGLRNLDRDSMYYNTVGPFLDSLYGIEFVFTLKESVNTKYEESDWDG